MSYLSLYRKWRPKGFSCIVGQSHVTKVLKNALDLDRVHHAYLFCGPRGTGKTSTAKLLAKALNCPNRTRAEPCNECDMCEKVTRGGMMDVLEIDAASNRGIDEIRDLREKARFAPSEGSYKVYIIDEVHMLTKEAFNALLKTLEEPPKSVIFILATTEPHKLPLTILSRCQRLDFRRISVPDIASHLERVMEKEDISIGEEGVQVIAKRAQGSLRDALSITEQCVSFSGNKVSTEEIYNMLGTVDRNTFFEFADTIVYGRISDGFNIIRRVSEEGKSLEQFAKDCVEHFRNLLIARECGEDSDLLEIFDDEKEVLFKQAKKMTVKQIASTIDVFWELARMLKEAPQDRIALEMAFIKLFSLPAREVEIAEPDIVEPERKVEKIPEKERKIVKKQKPEVVEPAGDEKRIWEKGLTALKGKSVPLSVKLSNGVLKHVDGNILVVEFDNPIFKKMIEKEKDVVEKVFSAVLGREVDLRCVASHRKKEDNQEAPDKVEKKVVDEVLKIFGGKVVKEIKEEEKV